MGNLRRGSAAARPGRWRAGCLAGCVLAAWGTGHSVARPAPVEDTLAGLVPPGAIVWAFETRASIKTMPLADGDAIYCGTDDGTLHAISASTGRPRWRFKVADRIVTSPVRWGGTIFVGDDAGRLHAVDAGTGEERWSLDARAPFAGDPCVASGVVFLGTVAKDGARISAVAHDGRPRWDAPIAGVLAGLSTDRGGSVLVAAAAVPDAGCLSLLDPATGALLASISCPHDPPSTPPVIADDAILLGTSTGKLIAVSRARRAALWEQRLEGAATIGIAAERRTIVAATADGGIWVVDLDSGAIRAHASLGSRATGITLCRGIAYLAGETGDVVAITAADGAEKWRLRAVSARATRPVVAGGAIYFGTAGGALIALPIGQRHRELLTEKGLRRD